MNLIVYNLNSGILLTPIIHNILLCLRSVDR